MRRASGVWPGQIIDHPAGPMPAVKVVNYCTGPDAWTLIYDPSGFPHVYRHGQNVEVIA